MGRERRSRHATRNFRKRLQMLLHAIDQLQPVEKFQLVGLIVEDHDDLGRHQAPRRDSSHA